MSMDTLEDGEIESDAEDEPSQSRPNQQHQQQQLSKNNTINSNDKVFEHCQDNIGQIFEVTKQKNDRDDNQYQEYKHQSKRKVVDRLMELDGIAQIDEYEMLCIRGGSPPTCSTNMDLSPLQSNLNYEKCHIYNYDDHGSPYRSDDSYSNHSKPRPKKIRKKHSRRRDRNRARHSSSDKKAQESPKIDEVRKMEICKFYLSDSCVKRDNCRYMHSEFPCKYYYLGMECENDSPCKYAHGKALTEELKNVLITHVTNAPRAILGNFKGITRKDAVALFERRNKELLELDKNPKSDEKCNAKETDITENMKLQSFHGVLSEEQINKITSMGISTLDELNQMSLAQLSNIGLTINQMADLQKNIENIRTLNRQNIENVEFISTRDTDMRPLLMSKQNKRSKVADLAEDMLILKTKIHPIGSGSSEILDPYEKKISDFLENLLDDEPELVIDESGDLSETEQNKTYAEVEHHASENLEVNLPNNTMVHGMNYFGDQDDTSMERISKSYCTDENNGMKLDHVIAEINSANDDYDMRPPLPFPSLLTNYQPALEIDASVNSHSPISYKLYQVEIPDSKSYLIQRPSTIPENTFDPRLKKLLHVHVKSKLEAKTESSPKLKSKPTRTGSSPLKKSDNISNEANIDPRKRKEKNEYTKVQTQSCNNILNSHLHHSKWYQNLNSKGKIEVNQHLASLSRELNKFSQNPNPTKYFTIISLQNANEIEEILQKLDIIITPEGNIISTEQNNDMLANQLSAEFSTHIPPLMAINFNSITETFPPQTSTITQQTVPIMELPKPGLLGIAPGIDLHPFDLLHNNNVQQDIVHPPKINLPTFHNTRDLSWGNCPQPFFNPGTELQRDRRENKVQLRGRWHKRDNNRKSKRI